MVINFSGQSGKPTSRLLRGEKVSFQTSNDRALDLCHPVFFSLGTRDYKELLYSVL